jgi:ubiquinone biosynthesis protein
MLRSASPGNLAAGLLEAKEFVEKLPGRVNRVLDGLANLAALIVGAALLMQVPTNFRIFGYPGLAMLFFLSAAAGGFALIWSIVSTDRAAKRKKKTM